MVVGAVAATTGGVGLVMATGVWAQPVKIKMVTAKIGKMDFIIGC